MSNFDMDRLTVGDYYAIMRGAQTSDVTALMDVMLRCSTVDLFAQPMARVQSLMDEFAKEFVAYTTQSQADPGTPDATRLLRDVFKERSQ